MTLADWISAVVRGFSTGPDWNAEFIAANRGRLARLHTEAKRAVWAAMKDMGGVPG